MPKPFCLGVSGGSCCGKSYTSKEIRRVVELAGSRVTILSLDDYYVSAATREQMVVAGTWVSFDDPSALDIPCLVVDLKRLLAGEVIEAPIYSMKTSDRLKETQTLKPADLIIIEGIMTLSIEDIYDFIDFAIFLTQPLHAMLWNRVDRDPKPESEGGRGRSVQSVLDAWWDVMEGYEEIYETAKRVRDSLLVDVAFIENNYRQPNQRSALELVKSFVARKLQININGN